MVDMEIDDITFLTSGESNDSSTNKSLDKDCGSFCRKRRIYHHKQQSSHFFNCSLCQLLIPLLTLIASIVISTFILSFSNRFKAPNCISEIDVDETSNSSIKPDTSNNFISTNGQLFPWNEIRLPSFIKPIHYGNCYIWLTIQHPHHSLTLDHISPLLF